MPRATVLCGSAREDGVTRAMCDAAAGRLAELGYDVTVVPLGDLNMSHCTDCGGCVGGRCVIDDDMGTVYGLFSDSDLLIMATPIHFSGPSSLIKTAMDRFQPYWHDRSLRHPEAVAALMCGGSPEPRFSCTVSIFRAFALTTGMRWLGHTEFPGTDTRGSDGADGQVRGFLDEIFRV